MRLHSRCMFSISTLFALVASLLGSALTFTPAHAFVSRVVDGSFESGAPHADWDQYSTNFGTPLCSSTACTGSTVGPRTGTWWGRFGGTTSDEYGYLEQYLTIPVGVATLQFYLWIGEAGAGSDNLDLFAARMDSHIIFTASALEIDSYGSYVPVNIDVSSYADGGAHDLSFESQTTGQLVAFNLDDVSLTVAPLAVADFDGNGSTDVSVYRPSNASWYVKDQFSTFYGLAGDIPVPADYDGNGSADVAIFRGSNGLWYIKDQFATFFGLGSDVPVQGDYDGDGTADLAVYRPSNSSWYVKDQTSLFYGAPGDIPVPGDYDGNGTTDIAVFRPSDGSWYVKDQFSAYFGLPADIPVPADYNGDGITDLAVYRPSNSSWYVKDQTSLFYGLPGDMPVPGDYNGDGTADVAVFRVSNGLWYVKDQFATYFGLGGDFPLPVRDTNGDGDPYQ